jgi:hypothetical protein
VNAPQIAAMQQYIDPFNNGTSWSFSLSGVIRAVNVRVSLPFPSWGKWVSPHACRFDRAHLSNDVARPNLPCAEQRGEPLRNAVNSLFDLEGRNRAFSHLRHGAKQTRHQVAV